MNSNFKKLFFRITILCLLFSISLPVFASIPDHSRTVKVGYIDYRAFIGEDKNGEFAGYGVEYLNEIAKYTNFKYEFIYGTWQEALEKLENKEIDLVCTANYSLERDEKFDYSVFPIGIGQELLYATPEKLNLYYDDFIGLHMSTIGLLEGSQNAVTFRAYAKRNNFSFVEKLYSTDAEMETALLIGEVDAIATEHMALHDNLRLIGKYGSEPFYCMSYDGNDIMEDINWAISEIKSRDATYDAKLYTKYYGRSNAEITPAFTREEYGYIMQNNIIRMGVLPDSHPLSSYDKATDTFSGITVDILNELEKISGLHFDLQPMSVNEKPIDLLKNQQFDAVAGVVRVDTLLRDPQLSLSTSILTSNLAVATVNGARYDHGKPQTVVIKSSFQAMQEYLTETHSNYEIAYETTDEGCLRAVRDGRADIILQNSYVLNYWMQKPCYSSLEIVPAYFLEEKSSIAILPSQDSRIMSILNKSIACLSSDVVNQFVIANTLGEPYKLTSSDLVYKYRFPLSIVFFLFTVCICLFIYLLHTKHKNLKQMNIKNKALVYAIAHAEQANSAKSQFLAHISHEIRTPINAIVGLTEITKKHTANPKKVFENLSKISSSSKLLLSLVNDVLDMSAIENEKMKIDSSPFDFKQLLNSITVMYYGQCRQNGVEFVTSTSSLTDEILVGDSLRVNQVLLNLLSNALKFTEPGGKVSFAISQTQHSEAQTFLHFEVKDTGCGMPPEMLPRIFAPFEQATSGTAKIYGGSGLGMAITKNLVDLMHGAISVKSTVGVGTTITVELPFGIPEHRQIYTSKAFSDLNALVVDDDKDTRDYASVILNRLGVPHECAVSGNEALEKIKSSYGMGAGYDLCFIDWVMPEMDGLTLIKNIRKEFGSSAIIIIVSAFDVDEIEEEGKAAGANLFVSKPFFQSTIFNILMSLGGSSDTPVEKPATVYDFSGHRILLAEDNSLNMEIALELLSLTGVKVDGVSNGKLALDAFENSLAGTYDLILMDIQMPVMDGHESSAAIRASSHPQAKAIPIYAITANAFTDDIALALSAGMTGHISKPIDTDILYSIIKKELDKNIVPS